MSAPSDRPQASRRTFLGGAAALAPVLAVPLVAQAGTGDHALDLAIRAYQEASVRREKADTDLEGAYERLAAMGGPAERPEALLQRDGDTDLGLYNLARYVGREEVRSYGQSAASYLRHNPRMNRVEETRPVTLAESFTQEEIDDGARTLKVRRFPWPESQARADEIVAAWDAWRAEEARRQRESGLDDAHAADKLAVHHLQSCSSAVAAATATTAAGLLRKVHLVMRLYSDREDLEGEIAGSTTDVAVALSIVRDLVDMNERKVAS